MKKTTRRIVEVRKKDLKKLDEEANKYREKIKPDTLEIWEEK